MLGGVITTHWDSLLPIIGRAVTIMGWLALPLLLLPFLYLLLSKSPFLNRLSDALIHTIDTLNYCLGEIIKWALPVLVLTVAFSVFTLSIFGQSWTKLFESAEYLHAAVIMLGAGATLLAGQHVRVDIFHTDMTPRARALVDFCGFYVLLLPVCLIILWNSQSYVSLSWRYFEGSAEADGIRGEFLLKTLIPLFSIFMIFQGLAIALRAARQLAGKEPLPRPPNTPPFFLPEDKTP